MTPAEYETAERFAALATRTLEKHPDVREEARTELIARLAHGGAAEDTVEASLARLAAKPVRTSRPLLTFTVVAFVLLGGIAGQWVWNTLDEARLFLPKYLVGDREPGTPLGAHLSGEERDFVFSCIGSETGILTKLERLRQVHPEHPGIYEEYTLRHLQFHQALPPDFRETWQRIDPDNGMWFYLEAIAKNLEWEKAGSGTDDPELRETIALLRQSASGEHFVSHLPALRIHRVTLLGAADDLGGEVRRILYAISAVWMPTAGIQLRTASKPISAEAKRLSDEKDEEGLKELIAIWERLIGRLGRNTSTLVEQSVALAAMANSGAPLKAAAMDLGMTAEKERIERKLEIRTEAVKAYRTRSDPKMSALHRLMLVGLSGPPDSPVDPSAFEPGRRVEYAVAERMLGLASALIVLLLLAGAGIESFRRGRRVNGLADGLKPLFTPADLVWVLSLGVVLPVLWYLVITRLTPCGCRDTGFTHFGSTYYKLPPAIIQVGAGLFFALAMLVQTCRWRITRRAGFLSLRARLAWVGWAAAIIAALVVPLAGAVRWVPGDGLAFLQSVAALGGIPLLWLLWQAGATLFSPGTHALGGALLSRRLLIPLALLAALLLACLPVLKSVERHWHARDEITRSDLDHGGLMRMESLTVEWIRGLFRETFPEGESPR